MSAPDWTLLVQAAATLYMTGLIWFVQLVHYPLMSRVGRDGFADYENAHTRQTSWAVGPPMLAEAATSILIAMQPPAGIPAAGAWLGLGLLAAVWVSTGLLQVPQHRRLSQGFDEAAHRRLVATNWIRVVLWTARGGLVLSWLT
jgi:hypothetical protein